MATYAIGDLHGDLTSLERLLEQLAFDPARDQLWFTGDLVNRGPDSLGCLRFVRALGANAVTTLGNHDLALLAQAHNPTVHTPAHATLKVILAADDGPELLDWLRHQALLHHDTALGWTMAHAGIPVAWDVATAQRCATELEQALRGDNHAVFLRNLFGNKPAAWDDSLDGHARLRYIANALTRQRFVYPDGRLDMHHKGTLDEAPEPLMPWFCLPQRAMAHDRIVFGHWAALTPLAWPEHNAWCIDAGAAWGGRLSALRLDGEAVITCAPPAF